MTKQELSEKYKALEAKCKRLEEQIDLNIKIIEKLRKKVAEPKPKPEPKPEPIADPYAELRAAQNAGKKVQKRHLDKWILPEAFGVARWSFNEPPENYRVKPDQYTPFTLEDAPVFRDRWVRRKTWDKGIIVRTNCIYHNGIRIGSDPYIKYHEALEELEFENGEPFGKLVK